MTTLITSKENEQVQFKNLEKVEASSHINNNVDASSLTITTVTSLLTNDKSKVGLVQKSLKDTSLTGNTTPLLKRNHNHKHKHKHHHHHNVKHHHHRHRHICHHHQNRRNRVKNAEQQQSTIVCSKAPNNEGHIVNTNALAKVRYELDNETASVDDQQPMISNDVSLNEDRRIKPSKGNTPLQSIENKLISQREASVDETQVSNFPSIVCTQPGTSFINPCGVQQIEQIFYEDNCCLPASTISCAPNSCFLQQSNSCVCLPQQQPQILLCTDSCSTPNYICSSNCNSIQQAIVPQQQYICSSNCNPIQTTVVSQQQYICVDNTPTIINQAAPLCIPQISQPIQIIQAPQPQSAQYLKISSACPQIIETIPGMNFQSMVRQIVQGPQAQSGQYLKISSACPQVIQSIPGPNIQSIGPQIIQASPQVLYQRPYDPIIIPAQNQQYACTQIPGIALSQPSYAPRPGPRMFQHALVRNVANRTGLPVPVSASRGFSSMNSPYGRQPLASTARALLTDGSRPSAPAPIIPLTAGGLLIPFQSSDSQQGVMRGPLSRTSGFPTNLKNFNTIRQQIQHRAQVLADIQRQNNEIASSRPIRSGNAAVPMPPLFSRSAPSLSPGILPNMSRLSSGLTPSTPISPLGLSPSIAQPPPTMIRSQTPYAPKNAFDTSSSGSSRSSASSTLPAASTRPYATNLIYSQPSFAGSQRGSLLSGPSAPYQSLRP